MICYRCKNIRTCTVFQALYNMSKDFAINGCDDFDEALELKYKKLAENDELMRLIYDYFLDNLNIYDVSEEEVVRVIKRELLNL